MRINKHFVAWSLALFPWLSNYATFLSGMSVGDLLLIVCVVYGVFFHSRYKVGLRSCAHASYYIVFVLYCYLSFGFMAIFNNHAVNIAMVTKRFIKFSLFVVVAVLGTNGLYDKQTFIKAFTIVARLCCVAIIVQYLVFYTTRQYVEFKIPLLRYSNEVVESIDREASQSIRFRPTSVFLEPAHFTYFMCGYTAFVLFYRHRNSKINRVYEALATTACMIMSISSTAIVVSAILWVVYVFQLIFVHKSDFVIRNRGWILAVVAIVMFIGVRFYLSSPELSYSLNRLLYSENETLATSVWGRVDSGKTDVESLKGAFKLFGVGLGNLPSASSYFSSIYYVMYCSGYVGLGILFLWACRVFLSARTMGRIALALFLSLCFSSPIIISCYLIEFMIIIDLDSEQNDSKYWIGAKNEVSGN